ncbi:hypothetical protein AMJ49_03190 [Parcubacteria bacterium DG_74_2]|nr:MAG: hypothetical protein AMJ49_03190 [Parcubacteria bacterium DG_74_2]
MNNNENYRKISLECAVCKTKFEIWISTSSFSLELEEKIKKHFYIYCPVCKALKELEEKRKGLASK